MRQGSFASTCILATATLLLLSGQVAGQQAGSDWEVPRQADGRPDLSGVWANNAATPLQRPAQLADKETFTDEELAELQETAVRLFGGADDASFGDGVFLAVLADVEKNISGDGGTGNYSSVWMVDRVFENRTSLITDPPNGRFPPRTPEAEERQAAARQQRGANQYAGPENLSLQVRCITYGIPRIGGLGAGYNSYYQIFQTPDHIVMLGEMIHDARVIPITDAPHIDDDIRQWHGDARAHWEGDTLVVETTNFNSHATYLGSTDGRHLVERLTRVGPDSLHYEITLTDPTVWTSSWTAMVPMARTNDPIYEYACHEGNIGLAGILSGARVQEVAPTDGGSR